MNGIIEDVRNQFYCHKCQMQFEDTDTSTSICPQCSDGFVEQLNLNNQEPESLNPGDGDNLILINLIERTSQAHQSLIANLRAGLNIFDMRNMHFQGTPPMDLEAVAETLRQGNQPALAKDIIDAIPIIEVTDEDITSKLKCSICWDEFQLGEMVKKLSCLHIFHDACIRPWLELRTTCPICREDLRKKDTLVNEVNETPDVNPFDMMHRIEHLLMYSFDNHNPNGTGSSREETWYNE